MRALALLFVLMLWPLAAAAQQSAPADVPLCEAARNPQAFRGQVIRLRGQSMSDLPETMAMTAPECPGHGVFLVAPAQAAHSRELLEAFAAARVCPQRPFTFTVVGAIAADSVLGVPAWSLRITEAADIRRADGACG